MLTSAETKLATLSSETIGGLVSNRLHLRLRPDCPVETVLTIMAHNGKRVAGVVDRDGTLQGFLTRSSLFGRLIIGPGIDTGHSVDTAAIKNMTAGDVMIANPVFLASELPIPDALAIMTEYGFRSMPVLGDGGYLLGIAEMRDLVMAEQENLRQAIESKDSLLSYFMHHEAYGHGGSVEME